MEIIRTCSKNSLGQIKGDLNEIMAYGLWSLVFGL